MQITVNGQPQTCADGDTVAALVAGLKLEPRRVAVELNKQIVRRANYDQTSLKEGDTLEIVTLVGGG